LNKKRAIELIFYGRCWPENSNAVSQMSQIKIDVWSDVVCPFCYLGKAKLEHAIQKLGLTDEVNIEWHSFQLEPSFPKNTSALAIDHLVKRKGISLEQLQTSQQRLVNQGKNYGIHFEFEKTLNFNTTDAHRLLHWSKAFEKSNELKTALIKAHFTDGVDLSQVKNLLKVVENIGLDPQSASQVLNSNSYAQEVQNDLALARQIGINGVPFFVFNQKTTISGAQPDSVFEEVLENSLN
jgi:predicted DsbA family dithiol-disulfide isomerase